MHRHIFMHADVRIEDIRLTETEMEILDRCERGDIPLETPLSDSYREAIRRLTELGVFHVPGEPAFPRGMRAVKYDQDGRCTPDELVEQFLKNAAKKREKAVKDTRKREERKRYRDALMANLPAFVREPILKIGHLVISVRRHFDLG